MYALAPATTAHKFGDLAFLTFKPLTLVPIATNLLQRDLLTPPEARPPALAFLA